MSTVRRTGDCSAQQVFDVLADGWTYGSWVVGAARIREVDPDWPAVGTNIHHSVGAWPAMSNDRTTVLEMEPGRRVMLKARGWPAGEATVDIVITPVGEGVEVSITEDATAGPGRMIPQPLRAPLLAWRNTETLHRLLLLAHGRPRR